MNDLGIETKRPPEALQRELLVHADELSMLPAVAREALELAKDPDCTLAEFSCVVGRDVKLAADLLSLSNSVAFGVGPSVSNLQQAVVRLGIYQCRSLILSSSAASLMKKLPIEHEWVREVLWQHSFTTALACNHVNRTFNIGFQGEQFAAGLLHDFGRLLLAIATPDQASEVDHLDFVESTETLDRESAVLGVDHCEFGAWFAEYSGLPNELAASIRWHHHPHLKHSHQKLTALTAAGDHIANHLQRHEEAVGYSPEENEGIAALSTLLPGNLQQQFADAAETILELILADLRHASAGCLAPSVQELN